MSKDLRVRVKVYVSEDDMNVSSVTDVWNSANWAEREVYDMFGLNFEGHPNLRRILLPDWWEGHPLRKDYDLNGPDEEGLIDHVLKEAAGDEDFGPGSGSRGW